MLTLIHTISVAIARTLVRAVSLLSHLQRRVAQAREDRAAAEAEFSHGRYQPSSKNDHDLPLAH
jgi:hypothetical protein